MYNKFVGVVDSDGDGNEDFDFDQSLIDTFNEFASQNISDLVVDLRYNGSVRTCTYLASLITDGCRNCFRPATMEQQTHGLFR